MYSLTLTYDERQAIDWVGHRYPHGYELYDLLRLSFECDTDLWDTPTDMTFDISESQAWDIRDLLENSSFECFADSLASKLLSFCMEIV